MSAALEHKNKGKPRLLKIGTAQNRSTGPIKRGGGGGEIRKGGNRTLRDLAHWEMPAMQIMVSKKNQGGPQLSWRLGD